MESFSADEATNGAGSRTQTSTILNACHEVNKDIQSKRTSLEVEPQSRMVPDQIISHLMKSTSSPVYMVTKDDLYQVVKTLCVEYLAEKQTATEDKLISVKEAVFLLNVDRSTLWHWEKRDFLLPVRIGRKVYYRMADIKKIQGGAQ